MRRKLAPRTCFRFEGTVPGDKSVTHRAYLIATRARGETTITGALRARDTDATLAVCRALGADTEVEGDRVRLRPPARLQEPARPLDCENAGTLVRLLAGLLAGTGIFAVMTGDDSLRSRPMRRVVEPLRQLGARIEGRGQGDLLPLAILPARLEGRSVSLPLPSAQVKSAVLLAALDADGETQLSDLRPTRDHTERMLRQFGAEMELGPDAIRVRGGQPLVSPGHIEVPGDISHAAFLLAAAALSPTGEATVRGVGLNPGRTGLLEVLRRMGAYVELWVQRELPEPSGNVTVRGDGLVGVDISGDEIPALIDELPVIAALALCARGVTTVRGASELRVKETDRIAALRRMAEAVGGLFEELPDGFRIEGQDHLRGGVVDSLGDHRIAMAGALLSLRCLHGVEVEGADAASVSFPGFFDLFEAASPR